MSKNEIKKKNALTDENLEDVAGGYKLFQYRYGRNNKKEVTSLDTTPEEQEYLKSQGYYLFGNDIWVKDHDPVSHYEIMDVLIKRSQS